jgi:hypothetical protein
VIPSVDICTGITQQPRNGLVLIPGGVVKRSSTPIVLEIGVGTLIQEERITFSCSFSAATWSALP